ncbi:MAG: nucleotidyltransferase family protein [Anaerolineae bacterium]
MNISQELYPALADFIARAGEVPNLRAAVLFGSTVTGEFRRKSDVDVLLLFDTDHKQPAASTRSPGTPTMLTTTRS